MIKKFNIVWLGVLISQCFSCDSFSKRTRIDVNRSETNTSIRELYPKVNSWKQILSSLQLRGTMSVGSDVQFKDGAGNAKIFESEVEVTRFFNSNSFVVLESEGKGERFILSKFSDSGIERLNNFYFEKIAKLKSIYDDTRDPYFAVITKSTSCPPPFFPEIVESNNKIKDLPDQFMMFGFASRMDRIGVCDKESAKKRFFIKVLKCLGQVYFFEWFVEIEKLDPRYKEEMFTLDCGPQGARR